MTNNETSPSGDNLEEARIFLNSAEIDGWLTRDYRYTNPVFEAALGLHIENLTRPVWLWIPANGEPSILAHEVDIGRFPQGPIALVPYGSRNQMVEALKQILNGAKTVAMEYSPLYELPRVGRVDAGTIELVRSLGADVVSSGDLIQHATERWTPVSYTHLTQPKNREV